ncbi:hypothetical protein N7448_010663 [Penicillium atrosanguineum]|uniref:Autophagy-related protein 29 n=1 Tax=Penicillium atrosanguineum TaxID=1132637 RepID=A0A9W9KUA4_9EURO|nr:uncharacterized protein N7443_007884 [Penicillium atrosanguineum]KAJ5118955.1 hypothetical protein N7526_010592 [Penicillium atrosanguineum]KAJ5119994.1 hypothetical protein N7448_010663 [Penicillium atrosanguineum]KAJ5296991.1 hypothetical protein N7443_007884 [Penicillium atrosanguineum]KAJ5299751.1 hypothetical protein N7476_011308 [Penicillium atrosanguineum]
MARSDPGDTNFTVFIRLPFPREDFVDPPPVEWNALKDQKLWDILSRPSKGDDIDWKALADNFDVTLQFLLQQAAWLYDRQLSQVRAQMRKVPTAQSNSPSPAPGSVSGSTAFPGLSQKGNISTGPRAPSRQLSQQKDIPQRGPTGRRASSTSTTTVNQFQHSRDTSRNDTPTTDGREQRWESYVRRPSVTKKENPPVASFLRSPPLEEEDLSSSEDSDSEEDSSRRGPRYRRFGKFSTQRAGLRDDEDDDEEDDTPAFLPMARDTEPGPRDRPGGELSATLRLDAERAATARRHMADRSGTRRAANLESSTSSISSGAPASHTQGDSGRIGPLSPHRAGMAPRQSSRKSTASGREASDGTPSMGSSFSDLDDASVTQSALEEALASNMQHGGMASRMSTISQALRSRYLQ